MRHKAIALISGGLDSLLAAEIIKQQGIDILGVCFKTQFAEKDPEAFERKVRDTAAQIDIPMRFEDISGDFVDLLRGPKHGFGANMNPCIDCKILMFSKAKKIMRQEKASFIVTGEVLGERPMSQNKTSLEVIEKESGLGDRVLRPLSAKSLIPTDIEKKDIVDRDKLFAIEGRSRNKQIKLAQKYGINKYFTPAGGCLLTDPIFSVKLKELIKYKDFSPENIELLKYGRHFRIDEETKIVISRNEGENRKLRELKKKKDTLLRLKKLPGPYALIKGGGSLLHARRAGAIAASYSKSRKEKKVMIEFIDDSKKRSPVEVAPLTREKTDKMLIK